MLIGVLFFFVHAIVASETAVNSPWLNAVSEDFMFSWTPPRMSLSVPTTAQCDVINITWTPLNNGSPDPVPPYHLRVYTSTFTYPIIVNAGTFSPFEWTVPFAPDTQYQICMFDSIGQTGGCQEKYTMTPPRNSTQQCDANFTNPTTLSITGVTETGPLTQFGWPDQCTTLSLTPQNGTPPYNMTIAPSFHPPLNLTFNDNGPMKWTITLAWGMEFWVSVVDSLGAAWAYGPLHSGGNGPTDCLHFAGNSLGIQLPASRSLSRVSSGAVVGIAIASLVFGIICTLLLQWVLLCVRRSRQAQDVNHEETRAIRTDSLSTPGIDPYSIESARSHPVNDARPVSDAESNAIVAPGDRNESQVYVVHHDAGGAPITIFTGGRDVQELPPHYSGASPEPRLTHARSHTGLSHTPSASMDSTANTSSAARRGKMTPPLRTVSN